MLPIPPPTLEWIYAATVFLAILIVLVAIFVGYGIGSIREDVAELKSETLGDHIRTRFKISDERSFIAGDIERLDTKIANRLAEIAVDVVRMQDELAGDTKLLYAKDVEQTKQLEYLATAFNVLSDQIERLDTALVNRPVMFADLNDGEKFTVNLESDIIFGYQKQWLPDEHNAFDLGTGHHLTFKDDDVVYRRKCKLVEV